jgi:hypothetical protein
LNASIDTSRRRELWIGQVTDRRIPSVIAQISTPASDIARSRSCGTIGGAKPGRASLPRVDRRQARLEFA